MRGGEKVLENLCKIYPEADIFTHVYNPSKISKIINSHKIKTTFINKLPFSKKKYPYYLPLMPLALRLLNLKSYDLIISSESGPSKGVLKGNNSQHVCYCHTPMRYIWDMKNDYMKNFNFLEIFFLKLFINKMKKWDIASSENIDKIIANSSFVSNRIKQFWKKDSFIVHPTINLDDFKITDKIKEYYLVVSYLVPYKKIDLAVKAFSKIDERLLIIGEGPMLNRLKKNATNNIEFLGWLSDKEKVKYMSQCKALIFPGIEDFGITPIEVMACGRPVIAFKKGGVLDYIIDGVNGLLFNEQNSDSLLKKIIEFESKLHYFEPLKIQKTVDKFNNLEFRNQIKRIINL